MTDREWMAKATCWGFYVTDRGVRVGLYRRGQRCRFYTAGGEQVGPEQANVCPAIAYSMAHGWSNARAAA